MVGFLIVSLVCFACWFWILFIVLAAAAIHLFINRIATFAAVFKSACDHILTTQATTVVAEIMRLSEPEDICKVCDLIQPVPHWAKLGLIYLHNDHHVLLAEN